MFTKERDQPNQSAEEGKSWRQTAACQFGNDRKRGTKKKKVSPKIWLKIYVHSDTTTVKTHFLFFPQQEESPLNSLFCIKQALRDELFAASLQGHPRSPCRQRGAGEAPPPLTDRGCYTPGDGETIAGMLSKSNKISHTGTRKCHVWLR